jgi:hypothetical protein
MTRQKPERTILHSSITLCEIHTKSADIRVIKVIRVLTNVARLP